MKKIISILLSITLTIGVLTIAVQAKEEVPDLRIAVASDLHYNTPRDEIAGPDYPINDPIYWYANRRAAMEDESSFIIDEFLNQCAEREYDYVLISGDMVDNGRRIRSDHEAVAAKFAEFEKKTGKQVFVIDGNHDIGAGEQDTQMKDFKEIYADFGYNEALYVDPDSCSYTANLGDKYRLIALDSCDYSKSTEDGMSLKKLNFVRREAANAKKDGRYPIVMMHHNLIDHMPIQRIINRNFIVRFHYSTADLFANWGIRMVLTGHEHCGDVAVYTSTLGNKIYDFTTTSLTMFPLAFREIAFTEEEITYNDVKIETIDTDALQAACKGFSQEQIDKMNEGLNAYAKGFLKCGVEYRLWLSLTMEKLGISENAFYYNAVKTVVDRLNELLKMPLYGENSIESLASEYNIVLPKTEFKNAWDIATEFVAKHYEGEESYSLDSPELKLFLKAVNLILHDELATFNDDVLLKGANNILKNLGTESLATDISKLACNVFGAVTPGEFLLLSVISPFLYEFAFDADGVNDNRGTIEGYGANNNLQNITARIPALLTRIFNFLRSYFMMVFVKVPALY